MEPLSFVDSPDKLQIMNDIKNEIDYWNSTMVGFVLGVNSPSLGGDC